jgi:hypothetical protein
MDAIPGWFAVGFPLSVSLWGIAILLDVIAGTIERGGRGNRGAL